MNRLDKFRVLRHSSNQYYLRLFKRLTQEEVAECERFLEKHEALDPHLFESALNRWKLNEPKTKNHGFAWAILCEINSSLKPVRRRR